MRMQPIRSDAGHDAAPERTDGLMGAAPGRPEADAPEAWVDPVEACEAAHRRAGAPDPGP